MMKLFISFFKVFFVLFTGTWMTVQLITVHIPNNFIVRSIAESLNVPYTALIFKPVVGEGVNDLDTFMYGTFVYSTLLVLSLSSVVLGFLILGKGRSLFERLILLQAFALPKERENWGKVYDAKNSNPVAFASIRILKLDTKESIVVSSITDLYGRYRVYANFENAEYKIQVMASGYANYVKIFYGAGDWSNVTINIALSRENANSRKSLNHRLLEYKPMLYQLLVNYIYLVSVITFLHILYSLWMHFGPVALINLFAYGFAAPWNTYVLLSRSFAKPGKILSDKTNRPIPSVLVQIYKGVKQLVSTVSDEKGIVKLDLPQGKYNAKIYKQGYSSSSINSQGLIDVYITDQGFLRENISLTPDETITLNQDGTLMNPFA